MTDSHEFKVVVQMDAKGESIWATYIYFGDEPEGPALPVKTVQVKEYMMVDVDSNNGAVVGVELLESEEIPTLEDLILFKTNKHAAMFKALLDWWSNDPSVMSSSSLTVRTSHEAYKTIVDIGEPMVPYILEDMKSNLRHWHSALKKITGCDPITDSIRGNIRAMSDCWLEWAKK